MVFGAEKSLVGIGLNIVLPTCRVLENPSCTPSGRLRHVQQTIGGGFHTSTHRNATKLTESPRFGKRRLLKQSVFRKQLAKRRCGRGGARKAQPRNVSLQWRFDQWQV